jgi:hypothetical protein
MPNIFYRTIAQLRPSSEIRPFGAGQPCLALAETGAYSNVMITTESEEDWSRDLNGLAA